MKKKQQLKKTTSATRVDDSFDFDDFDSFANESVEEQEVKFNIEPVVVNGSLIIVIPQEEIVAKIGRSYKLKTNQIIFEKEKEPTFSLKIGSGCKK